MSKESSMQAVLDEIKSYYESWLSASGMTETELLLFRVCNHFQVRLEDRIDGFAVQMTHEKEEVPIGLPFFVGFSNTSYEKEQFFVNTPLLLMYIAGRLDKANKEEPINGSYGNDYFKDIVRKVCPQIIEKGKEFLEIN